jgi:hypothetical protein
VSLPFGESMNARANAKLVSVLHEAQVALHRPANDFVWSKWDDATSAVTEIDSHIAAVERDDLSRLSDLALLFAPTGAIQEVAESSGWGSEFLALAARFDKAAAKVRS